MVKKETVKVIKLVTVGDGQCGKTCLLTTFAKGQFPGEYVPTVFDTQLSQLEVNKRKVLLGLWDTAGQESYEQLRLLCYPDTGVFLVCFDIAEPNSLLNVLEFWVPEVRDARPRTPIVLVGTKKDLREDPKEIAALQSRNQAPVSTAEGEAVAEKIQAVAYVECSALTQEGVHDVFVTAVTSVLKNKRTKQHRCTIL
ncbi:ras-like GTP-binding protein Rho1 [Ornithodoros turicata]|uniref:ras-like GTP-binding protein Rho1 n=1 Tax=Ornithodoros turicata TaxID=34597 RepID=UPI003138EF2E